MPCLVSHHHHRQVNLMELEGTPSSSKKQEHSAKEKIRRMKMNSTYTALGALLPVPHHTRRKKRKTSAAAVIEKSVEYIPELEKEIEDLTARKNNLLQQKKLLSSSSSSDSGNNNDNVVLHEVAKGEVIVQMIRSSGMTVLSSLLENLEAQDISVSSASTLHLSNQRVCYNLHLKMNWASSLAVDYITLLRRTVIS